MKKKKRKVVTISGPTTVEEWRAALHEAQETFREAARQQSLAQIKINAALTAISGLVNGEEKKNE